MRKLGLARCLAVLLLVVSITLVLPHIEVQGVSLSPHAPIVIKTNSDFTTPNGVVGGTGSQNDPYLISDWQIDAGSVNGVSVANTTAFFVIRNVNIQGGVRGFLLTGVQNGRVTNTTAAAQDTIEYSSFITVDTSNLNTVIITSSSNVALRQNNTTAYSSDGVQVHTSSAVKISGNTMAVKGITGIWVEHSSNVTVAGNTLLGSRSSVIFVQASSGILISKNNITATNGGYTPSGVSIENTPGAVIDGNWIQNPQTFGGGIGVSSGDRPVITNNILKNSYVGIALGTVAYASVSSNRIENSSHAGLDLGTSHNSVISGNTFVSRGIARGENRDSTVTPDNVVNGKPIYFYNNCISLDLDGIPVGELVAFDCRGLRLANLQAVPERVELLDTEGALILHNTFSFGATMTGSDLTIVGNQIGTTQPLDPNYLSLTLNAERALVTNNTFHYTVYANGTGVSVYHNNLLGGPVQVQRNAFGGYADVKLDNGYPSGGNYYGTSTPDNCSGPAQNICPDPDGIIDQPMGGDRYPLAKPYNAAADSSPPSWNTGAALAASPAASSLTLTWSPARDDQQVVVYRIYQGTSIVGYVPGTFTDFTVTGLSPGTEYTFQVSAGDAAGNWSPVLTVKATTMADTCCSFLFTWQSILVEVAVLAVGLLGIMVYWRRRGLHLFHKTK